MRIYVDKLPKSCEECPMSRSGSLKLQKKGRYVEAHTCVFGQYKYQTIDDEIDTCPLKSLAEHDKQVRKEVCEEIKEKLRKEYPTVYANIGESLFCSDCYLRIKDLSEILEQIQSKDS